MTGSFSWEPSLAGQSEDWGVRSEPMVYYTPYSRPYNYIESSGESSLSNASCSLPLPSRRVVHSFGDRWPEEPRIKKSSGLHCLEKQVINAMGCKRPTTTTRRRRRRAQTKRSRWSFDEDQQTRQTDTKMLHRPLCCWIETKGRRTRGDDRTRYKESTFNWYIGLTIISVACIPTPKCTRNWLHALPAIHIKRCPDNDWQTGAAFQPNHCHQLRMGRSVGRSVD